MIRLKLELRRISISWIEARIVGGSLKERRGEVSWEKAPNERRTPERAILIEYDGQLSCYDK